MGELKFAILVIVAAFLTASEALSTTTNANPVKLTSDRASSRRRLLRTVTRADEDDEDDEERVLLSEKALMKLSKLAEKHGMHDLSKKFEHTSWLKAEKGPQYHFYKNGWKGKTIELLMQDPTYLRYLGFDDIWIKAQQKRGIIYTAGKWKKLMEEQMKKAKAAS